MTEFDTIILGAGAAGMMCAAHCDGRVLVVDHAKKPGEKIRISGGGRCNFTNLGTAPENFLSANPHFCKSALTRYTQWDFLDLVNRHNIQWHEKTLGQLFCNESAKQIIDMLLAEMAPAALWLQTKVGEVSHDGVRFHVALEKDGQIRRTSAPNLVLATGGKSIPKMGATGLAYQLGQQFGLKLTETRPALVPFTFGPDIMADFTPLAGVATPARVKAGPAEFDEALLFTHRGMSGPAILQASSYWREGQDISVNLVPNGSMLTTLRARRTQSGRRAITTHLAELLPARLAAYFAKKHGVSGNLADWSDARLTALCDTLTDWRLRPNGTEGYRTAEVTLGGIDTSGLNSRTMGATNIEGLYVIGEAVDVTGWLGGYNFQWAWSSGWAAGTAIAARGR